MPRHPPDNESPAALKLYTADQAKEVLNTSRHQVYRLAHAGKLELVRIGHQLRVTERSVYRYINNQLQYGQGRVK